MCLQAIYSTSKKRKFGKKKKLYLLKSDVSSGYYGTSKKENLVKTFISIKT